MRELTSGNLRLTGNTISSTAGAINLDSASGVINLLDNVAAYWKFRCIEMFNSEETLHLVMKTLTVFPFVAGINSNLIPDTTSTYSLGTSTNTWSKLFVTKY